MSFAWRSGNRLQLLENGEAYYPAVLQAVQNARQEILIETFILFEDKVGWALHAALLAAARRGVGIDLTVDGYGSADLSTAFTQPLVEAGVRLHVFEPAQRVLGQRTNLFRRLHRKIVVVDNRTAFVGGINFSADHLGDFGPEAKQDYALRVEGPVVTDIRDFAHSALQPAAVRHRPRWWQRRRPLPVPDVATEGSQALFCVRDNQLHRTDIEQHYIAAIRQARERILIANAYFFPGYRLLQELRNAARRGIAVTLILQGQPDMPIARFGARMLYNDLLRDGVTIYEYGRRPLHAKVALIDHDWATIGSSNLDPFSLALNLESNLIIRDARFNACLDDNLSRLQTADCQRIPLERMLRGDWWRAPLLFLIFHFLRHFPAITGRIPAAPPRVESLQAERDSSTSDPESGG